MKRCPSCDQLLSDDNDFCTNDGTPLILASGQHGFGGFQSSAEVPTQYIQRPLTPQQVSPAKSLFRPYFMIGVLVMILAGTGIIIFLLQSDRRNAKTEANEKNQADNPPTNTAIIGQPQIDNANYKPNLPIELPTAPPRPRVSTARVHFAKGAISTSVSGAIYPGDVKNYVLACRYGQNMTVTVTASEGCVTFADGSTIIRNTTKQGDNVLSIRSNCRGNANFRLEITII